MSQREPSMEDILASIKKVIAEEKEIRAAAPPAPREVDFSPTIQGIADDEEDDVLELGEEMEQAAPPPAPELEPVDFGPPLVEERAADQSRARLEQLASIAAAAPPPAPSANPLEDVVRDMLRPILKQWLDDNLPQIVDEHVKREISRITGKPL